MKLQRQVTSYNALKEAGADVVTLGNHSWGRRETLEFIGQTTGLIRPINYISGTPGRGSVLVRMRDGRQALILNALGRLSWIPSTIPSARLIMLSAANRLGLP
jgi:2',3'-cyclic-nucleotide 2'-phosphodiesterase